jgi:hypothetical protein
VIQFLSPSASSLEQRVVMLCGGRAPAEVSSRRPRGMWFGFERDYAPCHSTSQNGVPDSFSGNIYAIRRAMGSSERGEFAGCSAHAFAHRNGGTDIHSGGCDLSPGRVGRFHRQAGPPPSNISRLVDGRHCGTQHIRTVATWSRLRTRRRAPSLGRSMPNALSGIGLIGLRQA